MAASSSAAPATTLAVWLYDSNDVRVARVALPNPLPPLVLFNGVYYVWSRIKWNYEPATPYSASVTGLTNPGASVVAEPQF